MTTHDWTKLTNGWVREEHRLSKQAVGAKFYVYDDGDTIWDYTRDGVTPERTLELLTEAVEQRKQCEVRAPSRFAFGDWVWHYRYDEPLQVIEVVHPDAGYEYVVYGSGWLAITHCYESDLEPCDPPGDGGSK